MGLADKINSRKEALAEIPRNGCGFGIILLLLEPEDRDALQAAIDNPNFIGTRIADMLHEWAPEITATSKAQTAEELERENQLLILCGNIKGPTVQRHRRGVCSCLRAGGSHG